jgi:hypothetical protein
MSFDGKAWTTHDLKLKGAPDTLKALLGPGDLVSAGRRLLVLNPSVLYAFDGKSWESSTPGAVAAVASEGTTWMIKDDGILVAGTDGKSWKPVTKEPIPTDEFKRTELCYRRGSLALFRGRLVAGTNAKGNVYTSPFVEKGSCVTAPAKGTGRVAVDSAAPDGTSLRLDLRTARDRDGLASAPWSPSLEIPDGHAWWQLRVSMESDKARRFSPVVRYQKN